MTGARVVADDELVWWALTVPIPDTGHRVGEDRLSRILVALAMHANTARVAWPSAESVGKSLGIDRRTVRGAFDALTAAGLIERAESNTRSTAWRLLAPVARIPATSLWITRRQQAGEVAGQQAGEVAGIPATKRREGNKSCMRTLTNRTRPRRSRRSEGTAACSSTSTSCSGSLTRWATATPGADTSGSSTRPTPRSSARTTPRPCSANASQPHDRQPEEAMSETYADLGGGISGAATAPVIGAAPPDAASGHRHRFDATSGWCGCGARDDGQLVEGSPAWRAHRAAATSAAEG